MTTDYNSMSHDEIKRHIARQQEQLEQLQQKRESEQERYNGLVAEAAANEDEQRRAVFTLVADGATLQIEELDEQITKLVEAILKAERAGRIAEAKTARHDLQYQGYVELATLAHSTANQAHAQLEPFAAELINLLARYEQERAAAFDPAFDLANRAGQLYQQAKEDGARWATHHNTHGYGSRIELLEIMRAYMSKHYQTYGA